MKPFEFEKVLYETLEFIPLDVRRRFDTIGVRPSLAAWQALPFEERLCLCYLPTDSEPARDAYRKIITAFFRRAGHSLREGEVAQDWSKAEAAERVAERAEVLGVPFEKAAWSTLSEAARYALFRLADPKKDAAKFCAAMKELL